MAGQSQNQFSDSSTEVSFPTECDVLVVGSGAGGLSAAVTAAFHGLKVIVAERKPVVRRNDCMVGRLDVGRREMSLARECRDCRRRGAAAHLSAQCAW